MQEDAILEFLTQRPDFLKQHAAHLGLDIPPHRVIALSDKKLHALQKKYQHLENRLATLAENASANDIIRQRQHILTLSLLQINDITTLVNTINQILHTTFHVTHTALKLWHKNTQSLPCYDSPSDKLSKQLQEQKEAFCTHYVSDELLRWLVPATTLQSFALLPFYDQQAVNFGLLLMGSSDAERFAPTMHNHYLQAMAEQMSVALYRCLTGWHDD